MATPSAMRPSTSVLPGFRFTLGYTLLYLSLLILVPLSAIFLKTAEMGWPAFMEAVTAPRVVASFKLTFNLSFLAAMINVVFGTIFAWSLVRYSFPLKPLIDALVDLPFALPTAVAGIALASLYAKNGWIGQWLEPFGIQIAYTPNGILVALIFIGFPFVVRTVQPVLEELETEFEEAAACLGANRLTTWIQIVFPAILPAMITGFSLAFARAIGEYGSVIFIAGNMPMVSEIAPLMIVTKLEQYDYTGATAIATVMLAVSFCLLLLINLLQVWVDRSTKREVA